MFAAVARASAFNLSYALWITCFWPGVYVAMHLISWIRRNTWLACVIFKTNWMACLKNLLTVPWRLASDEYKEWFPISHMVIQFGNGVTSGKVFRLPSTFYYLCYNLNLPNFISRNSGESFNKMHFFLFGQRKLDTFINNSQWLIHSLKPCRLFPDDLIRLKRNLLVYPFFFVHTARSLVKDLRSWVKPKLIECQRKKMQLHFLHLFAIHIYFTSTIIDYLVRDTNRSHFDNTDLCKS